MSILEAPAVPSAPAPVVSWRSLGGGLWAGRTAAGPVGTIERGRRFVALDTDGRRHGAYRTLDAAMGALEHRVPAAEPEPRGTWDALAVVATVAGAASALLALYALIGI